MNINNIDITKWDFTDDGWGGIDENIKKCVIFLNLLGINTTGSCSGHTSRNNVMPYILITSSNNDSDDNWSREEDDRLRKQTEELLKEFYIDRNVSELKRIIIEEHAMMSSLHNGGHLWLNWRAQVDERVRKIKNREVVKKWEPTEEEIKERALINKELLSEFDDFTLFLIKTYNKRLND